MPWPTGAVRQGVAAPRGVAVLEGVVPEGVVPEGVALMGMEVTSIRETTPQWPPSAGDADEEK